MSERAEKKTCFVISQIGEERSEVRNNSNNVLEHLIKPAAAECGYEIVRSDMIHEPGTITNQIVMSLVNDALVIADLTGHNPNVFYELAVRHAAGKAVLQIANIEEPLPFDIQPVRTVFYNPKDWNSPGKCKEELIKQIRAVEKAPSQLDNPVSAAMILKPYLTSTIPEKEMLANVVEIVSEIRADVEALRDRARREDELAEQKALEAEGGYFDDTR